MTHTLEIYRNAYTGGFDGVCECSTPSYEDGWEGVVAFFGFSEQEVIDLHHDHVLGEELV